MTQDEIIEMARQAGFEMDDSGVLSPQVVWYIYHESLIKFAKLVAAKEREACADLIHELAFSPAMFATMDEWRGYKSGVSAYLDAIRARGEA